MNKSIGNITVDGVTLTIIATHYTSNDRCAILLESADGEPYGRLTVNLPDASIAEDEILVKTWSENSNLRAPALASGHFKDTGRRIPNGMVIAEVWKFSIA